MRRSVLCLLLVVGCKGNVGEEGELTREQCGDLVRHVHSLEAADEGGLGHVLSIGVRSGIEGCLRTGTLRAHRCVMQAESKDDLKSCDVLFKQ
jgi:hypothetical protein